MDAYSVYRDIQKRTKGQFLIGVVGPVRTGKSTLIRRFLEVLALPYLSEKEQAEVRDALPLSGEGKTITTVEPKFVPKDAVELQLGEGDPIRLRLIDCVGFLVPEHSTIGLMGTGDGAFGELPRENFLQAEERTVAELKKQGKPFLILVNAKKPYREETQRQVKELETKFGVAAMAVNCDQLRKEDILHMLEKVLYEFPLQQMEFYIPKWVELLADDHPLKAELLQKIREMCREKTRLKDAVGGKTAIASQYVSQTLLQSMDLASGTVKVRIEVKEQYYYEMLSVLAGVEIKGEYDLVQTIRELSAQREEYRKVEDAIHAVRGCGYGVVIPGREEIQLEEPAVIHQGNKYGVKIKSVSPSIHMIKANIETEIAPIVGSEQQAEDLIAYIKESAKSPEGIWNTNIFGKSVEQLVDDGIRSKIAQITEDGQAKLQDSMQKIVNDSRGGMVCIII